MEDKKLCGFYMRVSTEDQAREGFSLPEQKERLETFCKLKGYTIVDYYTDAGIRLKTDKKLSFPYNHGQKSWDCFLAKND